MKKDNQNKYKLDYAGYLLFILYKLDIIDRILTTRIENETI